jgi:uroporphyrinogen-III synthase
MRSPTGRRTALLTRAREDNGAVRAELEARGWSVIEAPCVRTEPLADVSALRAALAALTPSDLLVLTSRAGADAVRSAVAEVACGVAAVGPATAERARAGGMRVTFVASRPDGRTLAREVPLPLGVVLLARSDLADGEVPDVLRARGARVREVIAYRTIPGLDADARTRLERTALDGVTVVVASPSAVDALAATAGDGVPETARFVAIGARTAERVRAVIGARATVPTGTDARSIADAVEEREGAIP